MALARGGGLLVLSRPLKTALGGEARVRGGRKNRGDRLMQQVSRRLAAKLDGSFASRAMPPAVPAARGRFAIRRRT